MEEIIDALASSRLDDARTLIIEYQQALGVSLCFQNFEQEIDDLDNFYGLPGRLYIGVNEDDEAIACVGYHPLSTKSKAGRLTDSVEMKRLYVKPDCRTNGLGRRLIQTVIDDARSKGYRSICLDTLPQLKAAIHLYQQFGFMDIEPYSENPLPGVRWMSMQL